MKKLVAAVVAGIVIATTANAGFRATEERDDLFGNHSEILWGNDGGDSTSLQVMCNAEGDLSVNLAIFLGEESVKQIIDPIHGQKLFILGDASEKPIVMDATLIKWNEKYAAVSAVVIEETMVKVRSVLGAAQAKVTIGVEFTSGERETYVYSARGSTLAAEEFGDLCGF